MYYQYSMFPESHPIQGKAEAEAMGVPTSPVRLDHLDLHSQLVFNPNQEPNFPHCFDPAILANPSLLGMFIPSDFNSSSSFELPADSASVASTVFYDPTLHMGFPVDHKPPADLHPLPHDCGFIPSGAIEAPQRKTRKKMVAPGVQKHEKQRRERLSVKFDVLKSLLPNSTKPDRATIVADTIDYINELRRTVDDLRLLVEKKQCRRERSKKLEMGDEVVNGDMESSSTTLLMDGGDHALDQSRSQWLKRKSKDTLVDVRIVEEEATIKLTLRRKIHSLVTVSKILDELQLELLHLSGGSIGDYHVFFFNTKIHEGSSVYAGAIGEKLIEAMELPCAPYVG